MQDRDNYKKQLEEIKQAVTSKPQQIWDKLDRLISSLSKEQIAFMESSDTIMMKKRTLLEHFNSWLFERYKHEFVSIPAFSKEAEEYVSSLEQAVEDFAEQSKRVMEDYQAKLKENEELKAELKKLKEIRL